MNAKDKLTKRLEMYWKFELLNVGLVPALMIFWAFAYPFPLGWGSYAAMVPMCGLLYIGGIYWRAKWRALDQGAAPVRRIMPRISKAQTPLLLLTLLAIAITILIWVVPGLSASRGDKWTAAVAAVLAALEYINYYHRQLQHFDHWPDFKRLLTGKGFRRAQMGVDLKKWKAGTL